MKQDLTEIRSLAEEARAKAGASIAKVSKTAKARK
jgi:hypothetical protein